MADGGRRKAAVLSFRLSAGARSAAVGVGVGDGRGDAKCLEKACSSDVSSQRSLPEKRVRPQRRSQAVIMVQEPWDSRDAGIACACFSVSLCHAGGADRAGCSGARSPRSAGHG